MLAPAAAVASTNLGVIAALVAFGFVLGIVGHLVRSQTMVVTGILVVAGVSCYFAFVLRPPL
jgi:hypothetical protein